MHTVDTWNYQGCNWYIQINNCPLDSLSSVNSQKAIIYWLLQHSTCRLIMKLSCAVSRLVETSVNHEITAPTGPFSLTLFFFFFCLMVSANIVFFFFKWNDWTLYMCCLLHTCRLIKYAQEDLISVGLLDREQEGIMNYSQHTLRYNHNGKNCTPW